VLVGAVHRHYRRIDGLVNNAGRSYAAAVEEIDPAPFDEIFHLDVLGPIVAMQAVIPLMRAQSGGSIVNINSGTAFGKNRMGNGQSGRRGTVDQLRRGRHA
jgi:NAD(P)-dependent dehydrogenase (short-subunit alcohol dehydrogenase family)